MTQFDMRKWPIIIVDCPCGYAKDLAEDQKTCPACGIDISPLHRLNALPHSYYEEGISLFEKGQMDAATECLMTAIKLRPDVSAPYIVLGDIYFKKGFYDDAISQFEMALKLEPDNEEIIKAREDAKDEKAKHQDIRSTQHRMMQKYKRLAFATPVAAFIFGLLIIPLTNYHRVSPHAVEADYSVIAGEIEKKLSEYPVMSHVSVDIRQSGNGIEVSGAVPTSLHKAFISEVVRNMAGDSTIGVEGLAVASPEQPLEKDTEHFSYTVRNGDSLTSIAQTFYGNSQMWSDIFNANQGVIKSPDMISTGQVLFIPFKVENIAVPEKR